MSELVVNVTEEESRVALLEQGLLQELMLERNQSRSRVGDIFQGKVLRVMPGMEAAFVDIGLERAGFIHASDISALDANGIEVRRNELVPIGELVREGQYLIVQVIKDEISGKGARLSNHLTLPARNLVLLPRSQHIGVSQRVLDLGERERLQSLLEECLAENEWGLHKGFILRTAAAGATRSELLEDLGHLHRLWLKLQERLQRPNSIRCIYSEEPVFVRAVRDFLDSELKRIQVDDVAAFDGLKVFLADYLPNSSVSLELVDDGIPLFERDTTGKGSIESQITEALAKQVKLGNGGDLVIEQTESMVTIDVNTGSFVGGKNQATTILETNLEAADEIARQLRLRNLGGIIVIDFIDMEHDAHRLAVREALVAALAKDLARTAVGEFSQFGLLEMTRKRTRESLQRLLQSACDACSGTGLVEISQKIRRA